MITERVIKLNAFEWKLLNILSINSTILFQEIYFKTMNYIDQNSSRYKFGTLPSRSRPMMSTTQPDRKVSSTTNSTGRPRHVCSVSSAIRLVGPMETSFTVPRITYSIVPAHAHWQRPPQTEINDSNHHHIVPWQSSAEQFLVWHLLTSCRYNGPVCTKLAKTDTQ